MKFDEFDEEPKTSDIEVLMKQISNDSNEKEERLSSPS